MTLSYIENSFCYKLKKLDNTENELKLSDNGCEILIIKNTKQKFELKITVILKNASETFTVAELIV